MKLKPTRKIGTGAAAGALTAIVIWALSEWTGRQIPGHVGTEIGFVVTFAVQWLVGDRPR